MKNDKKMAFEDALSRIEEIIEILSSSRVTVDESVKLYKEASDLLVACSDNIVNAKLEIDKISMETEQ